MKVWIYSSATSSISETSFDLVAEGQEYFESEVEALASQGMELLLQINKCYSRIEQLQKRRESNHSKMLGEAYKT